MRHLSVWTRLAGLLLVLGALAPCFPAAAPPATAATATVAVPTTREGSAPSLPCEEVQQQLGELQRTVLDRLGTAGPSRNHNSDGAADNADIQRLFASVHASIASHFCSGDGAHKSDGAPVHTVHLTPPRTTESREVAQTMQSHYGAVPHALLHRHRSLPWHGKSADNPFVSDADNAHAEKWARAPAPGTSGDGSAAHTRARRDTVSRDATEYDPIAPVFLIKGYAVPLIWVPETTCSMAHILNGTSTCNHLTENPRALGLVMDYRINEGSNETHADIVRQNQPLFRALQHVLDTWEITDVSIYLDVNQWEPALHPFLVTLQWHNVKSLIIRSRFSGHMIIQLFTTFPDVESITLNIPRLILIPIVFQLIPSPSLRQIVVAGNQMTTFPANAFAGLTALTHVFMISNHLVTLPSGLFRDNTALQVLLLSQNHITSFPDGLFDPLVNLVELDIAGNRLSVIKPGWFRTLTRVDVIFLADNLLTMLPSNAFLTQRSMRALGLNDNRLHTLQAATFAPLSRLQFLFLYNNRLEEVPVDLLQRQTRLMRLDLDANQLRNLPAEFFAPLARIERMYLNENQLTVLPEGVFRHMTLLTHLYIQQNQLRSLPPNLIAGASWLDTLHMGGNQLTTLHADFFAGKRVLKTLRMERNAFQQLPLERITRLESLDTLEVSKNPALVVQTSMFPQPCQVRRLYLDRVARLVVDSEFVFPNLTHLGLENVPIDGDVKTIIFDRYSLVHLSIGWPGLSEEVIKFHELCTALSFRYPVESLRVSSTSFRDIHICEPRTISSVVMQNNTKLLSLEVNSHDLVDVSGSTMLKTLTASKALLLDVSRTSIPFSPRFCTDLGESAFFATNMLHSSISENARDLLDLCFREGQLFDFSSNPWLSDIALMTSVAPHRVLLGSFAPMTVGYADNRAFAPSRPSIPFIVLEDTPIECAVSLQSEDLIGARPTPSFTFTCQCSRSHRRQGDICVSSALSQSQIAGIAVGSTLAALAVAAAYLLRYRRKAKREKYLLIEESELKEQLLGEEVEALKKAWQVDLSELELEEKVDEGAFGEVWKGQWDGVTVAVKFMKNAAILGDLHLSDFAKELEFLRRTRHPHLVRFFGTGLDKHGAPFLVLEFVDLGSLRSLLLNNRLAGALTTYHAESRDVSNHSRSALLLPDVSTLKLSLLRDVAKGMAFLHSLNVLHRDLKTGNVLVTRRLVAKITDFGSMSGKLGGVALSDGEGSASKGTLHTRSERRHGSSSSSVVRETQFLELEYDAASLNRTQVATMTAGVGTPLYMAPEVLDGGFGTSRLTTKIDVFSYGVVLWEVFCEQVPDLIEQELGSDTAGFIVHHLLSLYREGRRLRYDYHHQQQPSDDSTSSKAVATATSGPHAAPPEWYASLTAQCMAFSPADRPSFASILALPHWPRE